MATLKKPRRVVALLHVYFVAIMLSALLERQVRSAMKLQGLEQIAVLPEGRATAARWPPPTLSEQRRLIQPPQLPRAVLERQVRQVRAHAEDQRGR